MIAVTGNADNAASIGLQTRRESRHVGTFHAVGFKFGLGVDSVLVQRALAADSPRAGEQLDSPLSRSIGE
jgi:L-amino acid N-acyltransferase YncA